MAFTIPAPRPAAEALPAPDAGEVAHWYETRLGWATVPAPAVCPAPQEPAVRGNCRGRPARSAGTDGSTGAHCPPCSACGPCSTRELAAMGHGTADPRAAGGRCGAVDRHGTPTGAGTAAAAAVWLATGLRFDALDLPAAAGLATLARLPGLRGPVALSGCRNRIRLLVAAGSAEELPGLLDWLEWSGVSLDLAAWGAGGRMPAPTPPGWNGSAAPGAAVWLRAPAPGHEVEPTLAGMPALSGRPSPGAYGSEGPGLVRLVAVAAAECHRHRLLAARARCREGTQRLASS